MLQVEEFKKSFEFPLSCFARQLEDKKFQDGPFFFGSKPMFCDFTVFHQFQIAQLLVPDILDSHPSVSALIFCNQTHRETH